jgi:hypothetical protein
MKTFPLLPLTALPPSRQRAIVALRRFVARTSERMQIAQDDHGTQSEAFSSAASRYHIACDMLTLQVERTMMPGHPLFTSPESSAAYHEAINQ